ncbi:uncharacterized protein EI90DRAFT_3286950 [Cantharellus anzutake]|uniref:uncharacterized protein n=1 Tax=Cantharellus anzutake TaxID=1750568 RepID=UPI0019067292|nr:uncharacterized protein EI90DRAFT_3286950 [Cantharellus anzutake]KAF8338290.1 hypothetical protein EI90DRAFT_3286950 [Cantharellus anzutake]
MDQTTNGQASSSSAPIAQAASPPRPSERWETAFVYAFICRFTSVKKKVEGFETIMDFEQALMFSGRDPIIEAILVDFITNLKPNLRSPKAKLDKLVASVVEEFCRSPTERSIWWDYSRGRNVDPLAGTEGFFSLTWDTRLTILRQLVEWQLTHCVAIRGIIDTAWGVKAAKHTKKTDKQAVAPPPPDNPNSYENLRMIPIGQDSARKRYWIVDDSPRIYMSKNPWKSLCPFKAISSTREEYIATIETLKATSPKVPESENGAKVKLRNKFEQGHLDLIAFLEANLPKVDAELARVEKARKRLEQKAIVAAQSEIRATRTRRQTRRPDYVYDYEEEEVREDEEYAHPDDKDDFIDDGDSEDDNDNPSRTRTYRSSRHSFSVEPRRSTRAATVNSRKRSTADNPLLDPETGVEWRGERRSTRLGNAPKIAFDEEDQALLPPPAKRARSSAPSETPQPPAPKPAPIVIAAPAGKKKSKFWYYTVETANGGVPRDAVETESKASELTATNETASTRGDSSSSLSSLSSSLGSSTEHEATNPVIGINGREARLNGKAGNIDDIQPAAPADKPPTNACALKENINGHADADLHETVCIPAPNPEKGILNNPDAGSDMSFSDDE